MIFGGDHVNQLNPRGSPGTYVPAGPLVLCPRVLFIPVTIVSVSEYEVTYCKYCAQSICVSKCTNANSNNMWGSQV